MSSISDTTYKGPSAFSLTPTLVIENDFTFGCPLHLPMYFGSKVQGAVFQQVFVPRDSARRWRLIVAVGPLAKDYAAPLLRQAD